LKQIFDKKIFKDDKVNTHLTTSKNKSLQ